MIIVTSSNDHIITLPAALMATLQLQEGEAVNTLIEGRTLQITPLKQFLALRGILQEDSSFTEALESLDRDWQAWHS